jgi:hypothetical protein
LWVRSEPQNLKGASISCAPGLLANIRLGWKEAFQGQAL